MSCIVKGIFSAVRFDFASPETAAPFPFWTLKTEYPLAKYVLFAASVQSGTLWSVFQRAKLTDSEYRAAPGSAMTRKEHNDTPVQSQSEHLRDRHSGGAAGNENGSDRPSVGVKLPWRRLAPDRLAGYIPKWPSFVYSQNRRKHHYERQRTKLHCKGAVTPMCVQPEAHVPIHLKMTLTIKEAAEYSSIGINKIDAMLKQPNCPFVLFVGTRKLVKRREFEEYIRHELVI